MKAAAELFRIIAGKSHDNLDGNSRNIRQSRHVVFETFFIKRSLDMRQHFIVEGLQSPDADERISQRSTRIEYADP